MPLNLPHLGRVMQSCFNLSGTPLSITLLPPIAPQKHCVRKQLTYVLSGNDTFLR